MQIRTGKSKWEMWSDPLKAFLARAKNDGFEAVEIYLKSLTEPVNEITELIGENDLILIGQILTEGKNYREHIDSLKEQFEFAERLSPKFINTHAGRDIFPFHENIEIYNTIIDLIRQSKIPVYIETHRGRPTYSAVETRKYLEEIPELEITADFSHWTVVHESDLSDQKDTIDLAISRSGYIHARPGYQEGPQITDPRAPEWKGIVEMFTSWWQKIIEVQSAKGRELLVITPEFGPPGYMHTIPFTNKPVADVWELNVYMKDYITSRFIESKNIKVHS